MAVSKFITPHERRKRIEALLRLNDWSWYRLAKEMNMERTAVVRALKQKTGVRGNDPSLGTLKAVARAFGVSVGYLVDVGSKRDD